MNLWSLLDSQHILRPQVRGLLSKNKANSTLPDLWPLYACMRASTHAHTHNNRKRKKRTRREGRKEGEEEGRKGKGKGREAKRKSPTSPKISKNSRQGW